MNDVVITKTSGGLGRRSPNGDMISGLLANGAAEAGGVQLNTVYRLTSLADAVALKIDAAYDTSHTVLVFEHIKEYFRINPSGDLRLMIVDQTVAFDAMLDPTVDGNAKKLLQESEGDIRMLAVAYNPTVAVTDSTALEAAILKAKELVTYEESFHRPLEIFLEGKGFKTTSLVDFRAKNAPNVSVMVGQALEVVNAHADFATYAAVGTLLGVYSRAAVNESGAWIQKNNLFGGSLSAAAIGGIAVTELSGGMLNDINDDGAIFFRSVVGISGYYFNDSHTCAAITSDYAYIENNRTINKAIRNIRTALLPSLNAPVLVDPETGQLPPQVIKADEAIARKALIEMQNNAEVSGIDVFMDPEQNVLATSERKIKFSLIPTGTGRKISVEIGFSNPNSN